MGVEMLRGVYTERSECAQHDSTSLNEMALSCHPERSEGSVAMGVEMLRGVYTERSECAQHDSAVLLPRPAPIYRPPEKTSPSPT